MAQRARYPPLQTRISRKAHERNLLKIAQLKETLGTKYRPCGREKRQSPLTERRSPSKPSQPAPPPNVLPPITNFLLLKKAPEPIVPGSLKETFKILKNKKTEQVVETGVKQDLRMPVFERKPVEVTTSEKTLLKLPEQPIPATWDTPVEPRATEAPFYRFGLAPKEIQFLLQNTVESMKANSYGDDVSQRHDQQAEMLRRIMSLDNGSQGDVKKFNKMRIMEIFKRHDQDTGSSEVQVAAMTVRILAIKEHLSKFKKDISTKRRLQALVSRRDGMLKYLRRKVYCLI